MGRPKSAVPSTEKTICLSTPLCQRVDLILFSEVEGRVPFGAWKKFIEEAVEEKLERMKPSVPC